MATPRIAPSFIFPSNAEEVVKFYVSCFPDSRVLTTKTYPEGSPGKAGSVATVSFELMGMHMVAANAEGDNFNFGQGLSIMVECDDQEMIDSITSKMIAGGAKQQDCGWVVDPYGVSWQIVPKLIREVLESNDEPKAERVMTALWKMKKIDTAELRRAANGN